MTRDMQRILLAGWLFYYLEATEKSNNDTKSYTEWEVSRETILSLMYTYLKRGGRDALHDFLLLFNDMIIQQFDYPYVDMMTVELLVTLHFATEDALLKELSLSAASRCYKRLFGLKVSDYQIIAYDNGKYTVNTSFGNHGQLFSMFLHQNGEVSRQKLETYLDNELLDSFLG